MATPPGSVRGSLAPGRTAGTARGRHSPGAARQDDEAELLASVQQLDQRLLLLGASVQKQGLPPGPGEEKRAAQERPRPAALGAPRRGERAAPAPAPARRPAAPAGFGVSSARKVAEPLDARPAGAPPLGAMAPLPATSRLLTPTTSTRHKGPEGEAVGLTRPPSPPPASPQGSAWRPSSPRKSFFPRPEPVDRPKGFLPASTAPGSAPILPESPRAAAAGRRASQTGTADASSSGGEEEQEEEGGGAAPKKAAPKKAAFATAAFGLGRGAAVIGAAPDQVQEERRVRGLAGTETRARMVKALVSSEPRPEAILVPEAHLAKAVCSVELICHEASISPARPRVALGKRRPADGAGKGWHAQRQLLRDLACAAIPPPPPRALQFELVEAPRSGFRPLEPITLPLSEDLFSRRTEGMHPRQRDRHDALLAKHQSLLKEQEEVCAQWKEAYEAGHAQALKSFVGHCALVVGRASDDAPRIRPTASAEEAEAALREVHGLHQLRLERYREWLAETACWAGVPEAWRTRRDLAAAADPMEARAVSEELRKSAERVCQAYPARGPYEEALRKAADAWSRATRDFEQLERGEASQ